MKTTIVLGTRPEIIKLSSIINKLPKNKSTIIFTGQHYDYNLSNQFFDELNIRKPDFSLRLNSNNAPQQIGEIISKLSAIIPQTKPDVVMVVGDTNTVLAASITSLKLGIPIGHIESGPRSFDWRMPEEHNRIQVDHISEFLFTPTNMTKNNLLSENVHGKIFVTGNTVIDAIHNYINLAKKKSHSGKNLQDFILMTLHRTENIDNKNTLTKILNGVLKSNEKIIFPVHPHTLKQIKQFGLLSTIKKFKNFQLIPPVGYLEMINLMKNCSFIITDSGGIQQEATSPLIRKKVLVTRTTTDSPEAVHAGFAKVIGTESSKILLSIKNTVSDPKITSTKTPYGKGKSGEKIIKILNRCF